MQMSPDALRAYADQMERNQKPEREPISWFRGIVGAFTALIGVVLLSINTWQLAEFGMIFGITERDQYRNAVLYGTVPWALAIFPFLIAATWLPSRLIQDNRGRWKRKGGRPSLWTAVGAVLYCVLIGVNVIAGVGALATERTLVTGKATHAEQTAQIHAEKRKRLNTELAGIAQHRPIGEVEALISRQQQHRFWGDTNNCSKAAGAISGRAQTRYCADYDLLLAELSRAKEGARLRGELDSVEMSLAAPEATETISRAAQTRTLAYNFKMSEQQVAFLIPLSQLALLEIGSMFLLAFSLRMFRVNHHDLMDAPVDYVVPVHRQIAAPTQPAGGQSQVSRMLRAIDIDEASTASPGPSAMLLPQNAAAMRAVFDNFWATRMRRVAGAQTPEATIYAHYKLLCAQQSVAYFGIEKFRELAAGYVREMLPMSGEVFYVDTVPCEAGG